MHRNTFILLIFLSVFAAIVVAVNLTRSETAPPPTPTPVVIQDTPTPTPSFLSYTDQRCGVSLQYPSDIIALPLTTAGATFVLKDTTDTVFSLSCGRGLLPPDNEGLTSQTERIGSLSATLYFSTEEATQSTDLTIYLRNQTSTMRLLLSGKTTVLQQVAQSLRFL